MRGRLLFADHFPLFMTMDARQKMKNTQISADTMVEPTGVPASIEMIMPLAAHNRDITTEQMITLLKLLNTLMAESAGKITGRPGNSLWKPPTGRPEKQWKKSRGSCMC